VGENKCAFEGCNALEFRTTGYCLRHKDENPDEKTPAISNIDSTESTSIKSVFGFILMMFGISIIITGVVWFMEDGNHWYGQTFGIIMLMIGVPVSVFGLLLLVIFRRKETTIVMNTQESSQMWCAECPECGSLNAGTMKQMEGQIKCGGCGVLHSPESLKKYDP
jgi:NADH:ubiquinone oxidoreductase subunit K